MNELIMAIIWYVSKDDGKNNVNQLENINFHCMSFIWSLYSAIRVKNCYYRDFNSVTATLQFSIKVCAIIAPVALLIKI